MKTPRFSTKIFVDFWNIGLTPKNIKPSKPNVQTTDGRPSGYSMLSNLSNRFLTLTACNKVKNRLSIVIVRFMGNWKKETSDS